MLTPKRRLKRKEIKEDKFVTFVAKVSDFFNDNSRNLILGVGAVVVIVVVSFFMVKSKQEANLFISAKLLRAQDFYHQNQYDLAIPELQQIVDEYSGTKNAGLATYYLAKANYAKENYSEAKRYFEMYIDDYGDLNSFVSGSHAGLAACYAIEGDKEKSAQSYQNAVDENPDYYTAPDFLFSAAHNYIEISNFEKARNLLQQIIDEYQTSPVVDDAKTLLAEISKKS